MTRGMTQSQDGPNAGKRKATETFLLLALETTPRRDSTPKAVLNPCEVHTREHPIVKGKGMG